MQADALARDVIAKLRAAGHRAYLVGGCVRDLLLGVTPKDFDVATDARPDRIMDLFPNSGRWARISASCWCATSSTRSKWRRSAATRNTATAGGRTRSTSKPIRAQDARRRDFTINGLMMDPDTSEVLDFVGGRADLERRVIRAIGDAGRALSRRPSAAAARRAVRGPARISKSTPATFEAIRRNHALIAKVSRERIRDELTRILTEGGARHGFELLDATGLLPISAARNRGHEGRGAAAAIPSGRRRLDAHAAAAGTVRSSHRRRWRWGALLHDVGKPPTFRVADRIRFDGHVEEGVRLAHGILNRLRFSRDDMEQIEALIANHMKFKDTQKMKESTLKRFLRLPNFDEHLELHRLDVSVEQPQSGIVRDGAAQAERVHRRATEA